MSLNPSPASPVRTVSVTWLAVGILLGGGVAVAGTAAYYELGAGDRKNTAPVSGTAPGNGTMPASVNVTDDVGRTVEVPYDPARVAVLSPNVMDAMFRLGLRSHVVAVDCYSAAFGGIAADYSPDQLTLWNLSASMCVQVGPTFDAEQLIAATPQLVLASTIISVAAVEEISTTYHLPVLILQPPTLSGILVDDTALATIFGVAARAEQLNGRLALELGNATTVQQNLTSSGASFPTVLVTYSPVPVGSPSPGYYSFGPGTFGTSLIELASATSISANATLPYPELTGAQVLAAQPTFIVYGTGFGLNESSYAQGPDWSSLTAVTAGHAVGMNSNYLTEPDPTMILDGLPALLALFHPDVPV